MFSFSQVSLGIDLGTSNCRIFVGGKGLTLQEPSLVCVKADDMRQVLAMGEEAKKMLGRTPGNMVALKPMLDGVIADCDVAEVMLHYFVNRALRYKKSILPPRAVIGVPCEVTLVEKRAVEDALRNAGVRQIYIVEMPIVAAYGAGLDIFSPEGNMIVDVGGGRTEMAVLSLGGIVVSKSLRMAGNKLDESIISFIKREYNLLIGEKTAEAVKMDIGSALPLNSEETCMIRGRDLVTGLPQTVEIHHNDIFEAMQEPLSQITDAVYDLLENTPPELAGDIMKKGIILCGGASQLNNLEKFLAKQTGIPVKMALDPCNCVAIGAGKLCENRELLQMVLDKFEER